MALPKAQGDPPCRRCKEVESERKKTDTEPHSFSLHVNLSIFHRVKTKDKNQALLLKAQKKADKKKTLYNLERIVSALRNSLGGTILIHFLGHHANDLYLGHFDDFIGTSFKSLIQSGELYVDAYSRKWYDNDFLVITVTQSEAVATVDFNTKVNTDFENACPSSSNILSILRKDQVNDVTPPRIRGVDPDLQQLHECRCIQLKCFMPKEDQVDINSNDYITQVVDYIWNDLKFKHNLTSMSKVDGGGSFYVGIEERDITTTYERKIPSVTGFDYHETEDAFKEAFLQKLRDNVTVLHLDGTFSDQVDTLNLIALEFHTVNSLTVLEIAIRYFDGILFYDKQGPCAFYIVKDDIQRMTRNEWLKRTAHAKR